MCGRLTVPAVRAPVLPLFKVVWCGIHSMFQPPRVIELNPTLMKMMHILDAPLHPFSLSYSISLAVHSAPLALSTVSSHVCQVVCFFVFHVLHAFSCAMRFYTHYFPSQSSFSISLSV